MEKTRSYIGLFIISPEKQEALDEIISGISSIINDNSGDITNKNVIGKKALAYPIKKKSEGIYCEIDFNAEPGSISSMLRQFRINTDILRTLIDKKG